MMLYLGAQKFQTDPPVILQHSKNNQSIYSQKMFSSGKSKETFLCPESVTRPIFPIHLGHNKKWIPAEIGFLRQQSEDERLLPLLRTFTPAIIIKSVSKFSQPNAIVHDAIFPPTKKGGKSQQTSTHLSILWYIIYLLCIFSENVTWMPFCQ